MAELSITSLRGGLNTTDPSAFIRDDQCIAAENVEWVESSVGERRRGATSVTLPAFLSSLTTISWLHRHIPASGDETAAELWAFGYIPSSTQALGRKTTVWSQITMSDTVTGEGHTLRSVSLDGKLYLAYQSAQDRLHCWDGTSFRRVGLAEPAAPTVAEQGAGSFVGVRYYRVRYTVQSAGVTLRRSEPSNVTTYNPADFGSNGASARITKPASIGEGETHWEVEASLNNADFYVIATTAVGTTTFDDSTAFSTGYGAFTLAPDIGDYETWGSVKYLTADEDRLLGAANFTDSTKSAEVYWSAVGQDPTGVGNHERIPTDTDNKVRLAGGGAITGMSDPINGLIFVFKLSSIYVLQRTNQREKAYVADTVSAQHGAIDGSVITGSDSNGNAVIYFLDPRVGPMRLSKKGLQSCGYDIKNEWKANVNIGATVAARAVYYPDTQQVHWFVATGAATTPDFRFVLHTAYQNESNEGWRGGWATADGPSCEIQYACLFSTNVNDGVARSLTLKPVIGGTTGSAARIGMLDSGDDDFGTAYHGRLVTKDRIAHGIQQKFGSNAASILGTAALNVRINVTATIDFGEHDASVAEADFSPSASERHVVADMDNLVFAGARSIQFEIEDKNPATGRWELHRLDIGTRNEEEVR